MLILTRKPGESLYIGDNVKVTVVEIKGHQIRLGIDAPNELRIYREEIYLQILEENKQAAEAASDASLEGLAAAWSGGGTGDVDDSIDGKKKKRKISGVGVPARRADTKQGEVGVVIKRKKK